MPDAQTLAWLLLEPRYVRLSAHTFYDPDRATDSNCLCAGNLADNLKILDHFQYYSIILLYRQISALPSYTRAVEK